MLYLKNIIVKELLKSLYKKVFIKYRILAKIILNKNKKFILKF
jgi:hypothetical protein